MWSSDQEETSQEPVLSDWSTLAIDVPPWANQPGKPLFGNGEHLATVGQH